MIKEIEIKNFKSIEHMKINCNNQFNVLIGENNIGKTSIFEAIHLWKMCYFLNIKKDKQGFYSKSKNLPFKDLECIRVYNDMDLYPVGCDKKDATIEISLVINYNDTDYVLGFTITKVYSIDNAYLQIDYFNIDEFRKFADMIKSSCKKLDTFITINETRPVANIIAKEPYMYKAQILDKIAKGKSYEVLRNKMRENLPEVQTHIKNILKTNYQITEIDKDNKNYIAMRVDGKNILSFGSGFLQLAEIFSSIQYVDSEVMILLVDEPDAHLHLKIQKLLLEELKKLNNVQLFVITHNDRFLEYVEEKQILFINESSKHSGTVSPLAEGSKGIVLENLIGCLEYFENLKFANKLIFVEGQGDKDFLDIMCSKYENLSKINSSKNLIIKMDGIDTLNAKLISYSRALKGIIPKKCKWLVIRDTDCVPISKKNSAGKDDIKNVDVCGNKISVIFQNGYGVESTFLSDIEKLSNLVCKYYELGEECSDSIKLKIEELNEYFNFEVKNVTSPIYAEWKKHYDRQMNNRSGSVYKNLQPMDTLKEINSSSIQYVMTKSIMDIYLLKLHSKIELEYGQLKKVKLNHKSIFNFYYSNILSLDDMFDAHLDILSKIYD